MYCFSGMGTGGEDHDDMTQAVLTCQGDFDDPDFPEKCQELFGKLQKVLDSGKFKLSSSKILAR